MYEVDDILSIDFGKSEISVKTLFFERTNYYKFDDLVLMQSTGLRDKNGKEIFEGDILDSEDGFIAGVVEARQDLGMFVSTLIKYNNFERLCNVASSRKIIGNIWEDGELLER
ncbi:YopX family protein [Streptococcus sp. HMSC10E12]|uniref:YopX family protein n=1 Tax=Streptococcus sp. HMSC10E12 TaxID=1581080 RepID=UPI002109E8C2|nr:YopX family protein [Streptococcus sp. HMSC10E12]